MAVQFAEIKDLYIMKILLEKDRLKSHLLNATEFVQYFEKYVWNRDRPKDDLQ